MRAFGYPQAAGRHTRWLSEQPERMTSAGQSLLAAEAAAVEELPDEELPVEGLPDEPLLERLSVR